MEQNDIIQALLSDPERLSAAIGAVSSVFGKPNEENKEKEKEEAKELADPPAPAKSSGKTADGIALLRALKPFLPKEKQDRVDRAVKMLALADLASNFKDIL
jgi:hypothetical protein